MCVQGEITGDPKNLPSNSKVILSTQCTLYFPGVDIPHALQFKFTSGGSLREIKSGKCITSTLGSLQTPLTFSDSCDTAGNKISFVGMLIATHRISRYRMRVHIGFIYIVQCELSSNFCTNYPVTKLSSKFLCEEDKFLSISKQ